MPQLVIRIPGRDRRILDVTQPCLVLGRSTRCDVVLEDASLSRTHARIENRGGQVWIEDLGSRNGTMLNGQPLAAPACLRPGDEVLMGNVALTVDAGPAGVQIDPGPQDLAGRSSVMIPAAELRKALAGMESVPPVERMGQTLAFIEAISLDLLRDVGVEAHLSDILDRLFQLLKPRRGAFVLREPGGELRTVAQRVPGQSPIRISRSVVETVLERRQAVLYNDPAMEPQLAHAASLVLSGVATLMAAPIEHEGDVAGLLYLDARADRKPFTTEDLHLVASMAHIAAAKLRQTRLMEEVQAKRVMEHEMNLARQMQELLLPASLPEVPGLGLFAVNRPCRQVSGDSYGFWPGPDGKLYFAIADVAGKGVGPGLLMASFQAAIEVLARQGLPTDELALELSCLLGKRTSPKRYITCFLGLLDPATGEVQTTNAGHNPAILARADGTRVLLEAQGMPLAMFPGTPYGRCTNCLAPGDTLVLYTDGITEAADREGQEFDLEGLQRVLEGHPSAEALGQAILEAVSIHAAGEAAGDDRTLVILRQEATPA